MRLKIKVKFSRLALIADAVLQYADFCTVWANGNEFGHGLAEDYKIRLSVATELYYKLQERISKRYPAEIHKVPLELHHAIVLQAALLTFLNTEKDDFKRNAIDIVKNELNLEIVNLSKTVTS